MSSPADLAEDAPPLPPGPWLALLIGLSLSGVAGIVNQVVWQRALKLFLGGSETLSAMIVVLVFLFGLGAGAAVASRWVGRLRDPLRALAWVELTLAVVNGLVALLLGLELTESVYGLQRLAQGAGLPLRLVYAVVSALVLLPPTLLMGATVPFASAGCQRQLGATSTKLVPVLFLVNTLGAAAGALGASLWLLPHVGQRRALLAAVLCNAAGGVVIGVLAKRDPVDALPTGPFRWGGALRREELLGAVLGFVALGWEMLLFRALSLAHWPLPVTFAAGLCGFLVAWSLGVALSSRMVHHTGWVAGLTALSLVAMPAVLAFDRATEALTLGPAVALYALPCVGFGMLYGVLVTRAAGDWGQDVGRYAALNTLGSCLGVLFFTLVGLGAPLVHGALALAVGTLAVAVWEWRPSLPGRWVALGGAAVSALVLGAGLVLPTTQGTGPAGPVEVYWGPDGVVEVGEDGTVWIDGLWHTRLTDGDNHIGRPYSWVMAMAAVTAHEGPLERALVVGAGVGITSVTLAGVNGLEVVGYEINRTLRRVVTDRADQTLDALNHPQIDWRWHDARTGMALDESRYDVILSAPLHLRQAGSSMLLSREYLGLVKSRLRPGGVVAVYANEGEPAQALLVQRTLAEMFAHRVSWYDGIVTVASDSPISVTEASLEAWMRRDDPLAQQMRLLDQRMRDADEGTLFDLYDGDGAVDVVGDLAITDDWPLLEYPDIAADRVRAVPASSVRPAGDASQQPTGE